MGRAVPVALVLVSIAPAIFDLRVSAADRAVSSAQPPPLEIEFSAPVEGETDVRLDARIRVQFSRDVDPSSLKDRIRLSYSPTDSAERGEPQPPALDFTFDYDRGARALAIKPRTRFERFREVKLELLEGISSVDGSVLERWTLNFTTGGS
jgi:Bacterial Ig-like domain